MFLTGFYLSYLAISLFLTVWVARMLHRSGAVFLRDAFQGNVELADSVNRLLVVGFYLVNIGYIALALKTNFPPNTLRETIELQSTKLGLVVLILGIMHCFNVLVLGTLRFMNMIAARLVKHASAAPTMAA
jgi:hypothetical protein